MNIDFTGGNLFIGLIIAFGVAVILAIIGHTLIYTCEREFKTKVKIGYIFASQSWVVLITYYYLDSSIAESMGGQTAKIIFTSLVVIGSLYFLNYLRKVFSVTKTTTEEK